MIAHGYNRRRGFALAHETAGAVGGLRLILIPARRATGESSCRLKEKVKTSPSTSPLAVRLRKPETDSTQSSTESSALRKEFRIAGRELQ